MRLSTIACIFLFASSGTLFAQSEQESDLLATFEEASEIATKTKLNIDSQPSVVSVMRAEELKKLGVQNVAEALQTLPGIQLDISASGYSVVTVRGFKNPNEYLSDKIKLLVDGIAVNNTTYGTNYFYLDFPVELIDRIEVLRGPGSTIYGNGAFYGTVNIVTKLSKQDNRSEFFASAGSWEYVKGGGIHSFKKGEWHIGIDAYYQANSKMLDMSGDRTSNRNYVDSPYAFTRAFETNEAFRDYSFGLTATDDTWTLQARYKKNRYGNFYGMEGRLESSDDMRRVNESLTAQLSYDKTIMEARIKAVGGLMQYANDADAHIRQQSWTNDKFMDILNDIIDATGVDTSNMTTLQKLSIVGLDSYPRLDEDQIYAVKTKELTLYADLSARMPQIGGHSVLLGAAASKTRLLENRFRNNAEDMLLSIPVGPPVNDICTLTGGREPGLCAPKNNNQLRADLSRQVLSLYAQDEYALTQNIDLTAGYRYDDYTDGGVQSSYRLAAVWRESQNMIFKAMYGSSYRAPSWIESSALQHYGFRAGKSDLKPEETSTYELSAIFKDGGNRHLKINGYFAKIKNAIDIENVDVTPEGYTNYDNRFSKGIEIEYAQKFNLEHSLKLSATINHTSYVTTDDPSEPRYQTMPDIASRMFKAGWLYEPFNRWTFGTLVRAINSTQQNQAFGKKDTTVKGYTLFDETINYQYDKDTLASLTIKNLLNREIRMPSYYYRDLGGVLREGRNFILTISRKF